MKVATVEDLVAVDDPKHIEFPPGFDFQKAADEVASLRPELETVIGEPVEFVGPGRLQDASFFAELAVWDKTSNGNQAFVAVDFSAFGRFFAVWSGSSLRSLTDDIRRQVVEAVGKHGFVYVPEHLLKQPYPGGHFSNWCARYFDWI